MKKITVISCLLFSLNALGQDKYAKLQIGVYREETGIATFYKDTLKIGKAVKFIEIDGEVFEIVRKVDIKKAEPNINATLWYGGRIIPNMKLEKF